MALFLQSNACQKSEQAVTIDGDATMNVTIYIESMCKASRVFIQTQLKPIYEDIKDKVNLRFVTFALSEVRNKSQTKFFNFFKLKKKPSLNY